MTRLNAEFFRTIGLDPELVTLDPPTFEIIDANRVLIRFSGVKVVSAELLGSAFYHLVEEQVNADSHPDSPPPPPF